VPFGKRFNVYESLIVHLATIFADTPQQGLSCPTEGATLPTGVPISAISLLPLQDPLQRIIDDPPARVELGYEAI
jgi:hypothetical protein